MEIETTRLSSKGQIVIPLSLRRQLKIKEGMQFLAIARGDAIILKKISEESAQNWAELTRPLRQKARRIGLTRREVAQEIQTSRSEHGA